MKKNFVMLFTIVLVISACAAENINDSDVKDSKNLDEKINIEKSVEIAEGEACMPYSPVGQVLYDFEATSGYPEIENISDNYKTATFGLG